METKVLGRSDINAAIAERVSELYRQLSPTKKQQDLRHVLDEDNPVYVVGSFEDEKLTGIASMAVYKVVSGHKGWIEDVVVDATYRGKGIGRKLIERLLELARDMQLTEVLLFTEDHRIAARTLYESLGFKTKDSTIYIRRT
ncbi:phosphinothricin acetyltransferase [Sphingobacterium allocomposti]|jgi:GNAT superfamily N-acetyltransferase|uniref:Phosphinothricin acetyltransferase n=1 Tax=Sphingobacterium allocomposti TaxID=415956 RepID=A0A5S5D814_9SPHI|nr:GNAT family N-acetyltransferase [Sphingobacterium composti Yoo et al. 2007 non Ten et al. 2007]TYP92227.1 phosphinothricin acetyltransferase [Sphingobacterium composti Yoo et al. 2007 non Ten et al. 2007]HLS95021.1 GNAT family N-acetyltransferase [Sphingobacterium sp.]